MSFYYPPDLSAGSFRAVALVKALTELGEPGVTVDVVTTMPNRYASLRATAKSFEDLGAVRINRIRVSRHRSGMSGQIWAFMHFSRGARKLLKGRRYDVIVATSSRLFTAYLGASLKSRLGAKLVLDIRDLFVESIGDVLGSFKAAVLLPILSAVERFTVSRADMISVVSPGFLDYMHRRFGSIPISVHTNGVDQEFTDWVGGGKNRASSRNRRTILYAGNLGAGQALHKILPVAAQTLGSQIHFIVIGDGGKRDDLAAAVRVRGITNVELRSPVDRGLLQELYAEADALLIHVDNLPAFNRVLPSKIFECAATDKPLIAGVGSTAENFLRINVSGVYFFQRSDPASLVQVVRSMSWSPVLRVDFVNRFSRRKVMEDFAKEILTLMVKIDDRE